MELRYSDLAKAQLKSLSHYLLEYFGFSVSNKIMRELDYHISLLKTFQNIAPVYMTYDGFTIMRLVRKRSHVFYTVIGQTIYIVAITDTRMSPVTVRQMIKDELKKLNITE